MLYFRTSSRTGKRPVAHALADHNSSKNILVNLVGGITLVVVLAVIGMLISNIPDMMQLVDRTLK
ncbi:MAG: hypothetical protein AB2794_01105 [Candidatus Thiodiazotropha endolucinida]